MAAKDPSYLPPGISAKDLQEERASFSGTFVAALAYGKLLTIYRSRIFAGVADKLT